MQFFIRLLKELRLKRLRLLGKKFCLEKIDRGNDGGMMEKGTRAGL
jgi:hypothetical protein